jgi:hypothetical protein
MITKYTHYNPTNENAKLVSNIERFFIQLDIEELKNSKKKSDFVRDKVILFFKEIGIKSDVNSEVSFIESIHDRIDVVIIVNGTRVIVEIDNLRADQVVKKIFSRVSASSNSNLIYVTLCYYSDSSKGHKAECLKYMKAHCENFFRANPRVEYLAFVPSKCLP